MTQEDSFGLRQERIEHMLQDLASRCEHISAALDLVGMPAERRGEMGSGYAPLLRIIAGQQLSVKAAATIWGRVETLMGDVTPQRYMQLSDDELRSVGCSYQKARYGRHLSEAVLKGTLQPDAMAEMSDEAVLKSITAIKGFGRWSAEMYMMFYLGRENIWPVGDLAVRKGVGRILKLNDDPTEKEMDKIGERWQPYRSVVALLCWHYYANAPL